MSWGSLTQTCCRNLINSFYQWLRRDTATVSSTSLTCGQVATAGAARYLTAVFLNRRAAAPYRDLAAIIPGCERPEETTICYKIALFQSITNLNIILYLSTCHTVYTSVLMHIIYNKPTRCNSGSIVFIKNYRYALHVSDALCVHLQEHYKL